MRITQVFIKTYGWLDVITKSGNYALLKTKNNGKMCYRILGLETRFINTPLSTQGDNEYINL